MTVIDFREVRIEKISREYYRRLTDHGIESASLWLDTQLKNPGDITLFKARQWEMARKHGLVA